MTPHVRIVIGVPKLSPDSGLPLQQVVFNDLTLDVCPETGGIWFEMGEFGKLRRESYSALEQLDEYVKGGTQEPTIAPTQRHCPVDGTQMYPYDYAETSGVQLETCPKCGGIWVDHKALDKLAQRRQHQDPTYIPPNLTPEAVSALRSMQMDHEIFMNRASALTSFLQEIDWRPGWPRPWLGETWWGHKRPPLPGD